MAGPIDPLGELREIRALAGAELWERSGARNPTPPREPAAARRPTRCRPRPGPPAGEGASRPVAPGRGCGSACAPWRWPAMRWKRWKRSAPTGEILKSANGAPFYQDVARTARASDGWRGPPGRQAVDGSGPVPGRSMTRLEAHRRSLVRRGERTRAQPQSTTDPLWWLAPLGTTPGPRGVHHLPPPGPAFGCVRRCFGATNHDERVRQVLAPNRQMAYRHRCQGPHLFFIVASGDIGVPSVRGCGASPRTMEAVGDRAPFLSSPRHRSCRRMAVPGGTSLTTRRLVHLPPRFADVFRGAPRFVRAPSSARSIEATIARVARRLRARQLLVIDLVGIVVASYAALVIRFDRLPGLDMVGVFLPVLGLLIAVRLLINLRFGLYSRGWRFASIPEVMRITSAVFVGSVVTVALFYSLSAIVGPIVPAGFPRSFWPAEFLLSITILGGVRFAIRAAYDWAPRLGRQRHYRPAPRPCSTVPAGPASLMARSAEREPEGRACVPVGFLDDDPHPGRQHRRRPAGLRRPRTSSPERPRETGAGTAPDHDAQRPGAAVRPVVEAALALGLEVRTVPPVTDLLDGSVDAYRIRRVRVEDLLRRPIVTEHAPGVAEIIHDRVVMITGAGGSIGSELARQVFALGPRRARSWSTAPRARSTSSSVSSRPRHATHGQGRRRARVHLANVASRAVDGPAHRAEAPDVIFHAAAYKHVPMMEEHPSDAVHVNVGGTLAVLDAAVAAGRRALRPRLHRQGRPALERHGRQQARRRDARRRRRPARPAGAYVSVRFGNVLGSNGSVVPIFQEQLENGEPLTITDPDDDPLLHDHPRGRLADPRRGRPRPERATCSSSTWASRSSIMDLARDLVRLAGRDPESAAHRDHRPAPGREAPRGAVLRRRAASSRPRTRRSCGPPPACLRSRSATTSPG